MCKEDGNGNKNGIRSDLLHTNWRHLVLYLSTRLIILLLQALLPAIFQLISVTSYLVVAYERTNLLPNIFLMLSTWENTVHPIVCFACIRPLRSAFYDLLVKLLHSSKFIQKTYPKSFFISVSSYHQPKLSLNVCKENIVSLSHQ